MLASSSSSSSSSSENEFLRRSLFMFVRCVSIMFGASFTIFGEFISGPVAFLGFGFFIILLISSVFAAEYQI